MEFHRRRPWLRVPADAPFLLRVPGEERALCAVVIGQSRGDFGLIVYRGDDGFERVRAMILEDLSHERAMEGVDLLSVTFEALAAIPREFRSLLERAGFSGRRESAAPWIMHLPPGHQTRVPGRADLRLLEWCLRGVLAADQAAELPQQPLQESRGRIVQLECSGTPRKLELRARRVAWPKAPERVPERSSLRLSEDLAELPRTQRRWQSALQPVPAAIAGDERSMRAFAVVEAESGDLVCLTPVLGNELDPAVQALESALRGKGKRASTGGVPGLPLEIACTSPELHAALAPALASLDVACPLIEMPAELEQALESLGTFFSERDFGEPENLEDWKEADRRLTTAMVKECFEEHSFGERALRRYYGSKERMGEAIGTFGQAAVLGAFVEWFVADYRATRRSKTWIEKRLERRLRPCERALFEARRDARLSIFRVDAVRPGASLDIEDVLRGERHTLSDKALSGCDLEGHFLPLRLLRVGEWTFAAMAGPVLHAMDVDGCLEWLESRGADFASDARTGSEALGELWHFLMQVKQRPTVLQNFDGEALEFLRACYRVEDVDDLLERLASRADVRFDRDDLEGAWVGQARGRGATGGDVTFARLEIVGDELLVEVNSRGRLERARAWLDKLPGLRFEKADPVEASARAPDDRLRGPEATLPDEMRPHVEALLREQYRHWLDQPIPALGDRTPRQVARTPGGRRRVERMIRTMPDARGPFGPIPAPREELLAELGIARD